MIEKKCGCCKKAKPLGEFYSPPFEAAAHEHRTSSYCRQCHDAGKIPYGYGWYAGYDKPGDKPDKLEISWLKKNI